MKVFGVAFARWTLSILVALAFASPAAAVLPGCNEGFPEDVPVSPPLPESNGYAVSPGGVDMKTGELRYSQVDVSIGGQGDAGLALKRTLQLNAESFSNPMSSFFTHNWNIQLREERQKSVGACYPDDYNYIESVTLDGRAESFFAYGGYDTAPQFEQITPSGYAKLNYLGGVSKPKDFIFTASDGTIVEFLGGAGAICQSQGFMPRCFFASRVVRPDGTTYDLAYETLSNGYSTRLKSVTSSRGFALLFEHMSDSDQVIKVCALDLAKQAMPSNGLCPAGALTSQYSYSGGTTTVTDAGGSVSKFSINTSALTYSLYRPGDAQAYITGNYMSFLAADNRPPMKVTTSQALNDGRSYTYTWDFIANNWEDDSGWRVGNVIVGSSWDDGASDHVELVYGRYTELSMNSPYPGNVQHATEGPEKVTDQIGRTSNYVFCDGITWGNPCPSGAPLRKAIAARGNSKGYQYDNMWRVDKVTTTSMDGQQEFYTSFGFPSWSSCDADIMICNKPTTMTDANGNATTYTYSSTHGGVLTEVGPAVGGVSPAKKYYYAQKYAWLKTAAGGYAQAATPVWVLTEERSCKTSALNLSTGACAAGSADLVRTTYQYEAGSASKGSNLFLLGVAVIADGQTRRTCYSYDDFGRRVSETRPNANLSVCS